jgi:hypothetical protein
MSTGREGGGTVLLMKKGSQGKCTETLPPILRFTYFPYSAYLFDGFFQSFSLGRIRRMKLDHFELGAKALEFRHPRAQH